MPSQRRGLLIAALIIVLAVACDQAAKHAARLTLRGAGVIPIAGDFVVLVYAENDGAFLGLGSTWPRPLRIALLSVLPSLAMIAACVALVRSRPGGLAGFALVIGGGTGNLIDRLARDGRVTDFLNVGVGPVRTGIFNLADLFLMVGVAVLLLRPPGPKGSLPGAEDIPVLDRRAGRD
jgi:signal peptidase II